MCVIILFKQPQGSYFVVRWFGFARSYGLLFLYLSDYSIALFIRQAATHDNILHVFYLSSAVNLVLSPMNSVLTVRDVVLRDPLTSVLSSLGGNLNNPGWSTKVNHKPLVPRAVSGRPGANAVTNFSAIKASEPGSVVVVVDGRSADLTVSDSSILHAKNFVTSYTLESGFANTLKMNFRYIRYYLVLGPEKQVRTRMMIFQQLFLVFN